MHEHGAAGRQARDDGVRLVLLDVQHDDLASLITQHAARTLAEPRGAARDAEHAVLNLHRTKHTTTN